LALEVAPTHEGEPISPWRSNMSFLVQQLKEMQRSDPTAKEQWGEYCAAEGDNVRDPSKHEPKFIRAFMKSYNAGERYECSASNLVDLFKEGQRKAPDWKLAWSLYAQANGSGKNDPAKQDEAVLVDFMNYLGKCAAMDLCNGGWGMMGGGMGKGMMGGKGKANMMNMMMAMQHGGPPAKRRRTESSGDAQKDAFVARVKVFQRASDEQKQQWWAFADSSPVGKRDPALYDVHLLKQFCSQYGADGDAQKDELVARVKAFQRTSDDQKQQWWAFADSSSVGKRDPALYDTGLLEQFCSEYGA